MPTRFSSPVCTRPPQISSGIPTTRTLLSPAVSFPEQLLSPIAKQNKNARGVLSHSRSSMSPGTGFRSPCSGLYSSRGGQALPSTELLAERMPPQPPRPGNYKIFPVLSTLATLARQQILANTDKSSHKKSSSKIKIVDL